MKPTALTAFDAALAQDARQVDNDRYQQELNKAERAKGRSLNSSELEALRRKLRDEPAKDAARKWPSYTLAELEATVKAGKGSREMEEEIQNRKTGASQIRVTPQIEGGKVMTRVGRM